MKYINKISNYTHEVKQSKFIAYLVPYDKYNEKLSKLKKEHPKARHFVVAYRYLNQFNQIVEYSTDDGEPKGTSGKPTLFVLQGNQIINSAVIIVRYFGGTKLGTGGLVRAYSEATNLALSQANLNIYKQLKKQTFSCFYKDSRLVDYECIENSIKIVEKRFENDIIYIVEAIQSDMDSFEKRLNRIIKVIS